MRPLRTTIIGACFATVAGHAQQLVPNPSFESVTACPTFASMLGNAAPWFNPTAGTPELYHACAGTGAYAGVPANSSGGFQHPRTGQGFAGLYTYRVGIANFREYIAVPLVAPLEAGRCYRFSMFVNMPNDFDLACDGIGVHFSTGPLITGNPYVLPVPAHIEHPAGILITDSLGWTEVSGIYTAAGGEDHLTIGNFRVDAATTTTLFNPGTWYQGQAYLLVDDVSLVAVEATLDLGPDTAICSNASYVLDASVAGMTAVLWNDGYTGPVRAVGTSGVYQVEVSVGLCTFRDTVAIEMRPLPTIELGDDRARCEGMHVELAAITDPASTVIWHDGHVGHTRVAPDAGTYVATATNACGSASDTVLVIDDDCPEAIYLPNAITPDGDGINDLFRPVYDPRWWDVSYQVHDRWGRVCHVAEDGSVWAAQGIPNGVYVVRLSARSRIRPVVQREVISHLMVIR